MPQVKESDFLYKVMRNHQRFLSRRDLMITSGKLIFILVAKKSIEYRARFMMKLYINSCCNNIQ